MRWSRQRGARCPCIRSRAPRGQMVHAPIGWIDGRRTAVIGLAGASGLALLSPAQRDPMRTTTFGTGELIRIAMDRGVDRLIVGLGGSATCDAAAGLAQAVGVTFYDDTDRLITEPLTGGALATVARVERRGDLPPITVMCDVTNPLLGPHGSAAVYGPQKGATPEQVAALDASLRAFARVVGGDPDAPGAGAAGGAGYGLVALLGATSARGIDLVLDHVGFDARVQKADIVLTGEGRLDAQSKSGKAVMGVAARAARHGVRTIACVGSFGDGWDACVDPDDPTKLLAAYSLVDHVGLDAAMRAPGDALRAVVRARVIG